MVSPFLVHVESWQRVNLSPYLKLPKPDLYLRLKSQNSGWRCPFCVGSFECLGREAHGWIHSLDSTSAPHVGAPCRFRWPQPSSRSSASRRPSTSAWIPAPRVKGGSEAWGQMGGGARGRSLGWGGGVGWGRCGLVVGFLNFSDTLFTFSR